MFDYSPSEFIPFAPAIRAGQIALRTTDNQVFLQYLMSLGAHGAHKFI